MKNEILQTELDMPQLRRMVLENTERINRHELRIDKISMDTGEQTRKISEQDAWLEKMRREDERYERRFNERMDRMEQLAETSRIEYEKRSAEVSKELAELREHFRGTSEMMRESAKRMEESKQETDRRFEENRQDFAKQMKESRENFEKGLRDSRENFEKGLRESRENFDRQTKELREDFASQMQESRENFDRQTKELREDFANQMQESRENFDRQTKELREDFANQMQESRENLERDLKERQEKADQQIRDMREKTNATIRRISVELLGVTGHIVEGLVSSSTEKIFKKAGFDLHDSGKNLKRELASKDKQMEVDVMLSNEKIVVPVEVKANFTKRKVKRFVQKMELFREFFPECADKEVLAAVAAINYDAGAASYAHDSGLIVIRVSSNDIFSIDPVDMDSLRRF